MRRQFEMPALVEQMQIEIAEQRAERIRILGLLHRARPGDAQQIGLRAVDAPDEQARAARRRQPAERSRRSLRASTSTCQRAGQERADDASRRRCRADPAPRTDRRVVPSASASATPAAGRQSRRMSFMLHLLPTIDQLRAGRAAARRSRSDGSLPHRRSRMPPSRSGRVRSRFSLRGRVLGRRTSR